MLYPPRMLRSALVCALTAFVVQAARPETFDETYRRLQKGRAYTAQPTGLVRMSNRSVAGAEQIYVIPYAWNASPWWSDDQVDNLHAIVEAVKRRYNVDENRVVVSGVSDGGTGAYYVAMRDTTPYASFLPLNGYWMVLASADVD